MTRGPFVALLVAAAAATATAAPPAPAQDTPHTTAEWTPRPRFDLHWQLLMLPERAVGLAFLPVGLLVGAIEEYRLDTRFADAVTLYDGRLKLAPRFKFSLGDGAGAGLWIKRALLFDGRAELRLGGIARLNRDWQLELEYAHEHLLLGGRGLRARVFLEDDRNQRFYGLGSHTLEGDRRVVRSRDLGALAEIDLQAVDRYTFSGVAQLGLRRQALSGGIDASYLPAGLPGDPVAPPPGFDDAAIFADARVVGRYDTRDTSGRPTRGTFAEISALARADVTGLPLSGVTLSGSARVHLPVLPEHRVVLFTVGGTAAFPLFPGDSIPLDSLAVIGRGNVRGYDRERFRDRYAILASAEYRFPVYEYLASRAGLDAFAFFDVATAWGTSAFSLDPLRYSAGGGLRAAHETTLVFEGTLGWSPEGIQLNLGLERAL